MQSIKQLNKKLNNFCTILFLKYNFFFFCSPVLLFITYIFYLFFELLKILKIKNSWSWKNLINQNSHFGVQFIFKIYFFLFYLISWRFRKYKMICFLLNFCAVRLSYNCYRINNRRNNTDDKQENFHNY